MSPLQFPVEILQPPLPELLMQMLPVATAIAKAGRIAADAALPSWPGTATVRLIPFGLDSPARADWECCCSLSSRAGPYIALVAL